MGPLDSGRTIEPSTILFSEFQLQKTRLVFNSVLQDFPFLALPALPSEVNTFTIVTEAKGLLLTRSEFRLEADPDR